MWVLATGTQSDLSGAAGLPAAEDAELDNGEDYEAEAGALEEEDDEATLDEEEVQPSS